MFDLAEFQTHPSFYNCPCDMQNEKDPIKNEGARMFTTLYIHFSNTQGQLTQ